MRRRWLFVHALVLIALVGLVAVPKQRAAADTLPGLTVGDVSVLEGDGGSAVVYIPVDLSSPPATTVKAHYTISAGSASLGSDFTTARTSGTISFAANSIPSKHLKVVVFGDEFTEPDETITVTLSSPIGATLEKDTGFVTIVDDDANGADPGIEVNLGTVSVVEGDRGRHVVSVPISLSRPAPALIKVAYVGDCATAFPGTDYSGRYTGSVTFQMGQQSKFLNFTIVADLTPEALVEQFVDSLSVKLGPAVAVNQIDGGGTIIDNDGSNAGAAAGLAVHEIKRVSVASDGTEGASSDAYCNAGPYQWGASNAHVSGNGRYVVFVSDFPNIVPNDNNGDIDTFVHDLVTGETERVSVNNDGSEMMSDPDHSINPWQNAFATASISYDGRYVVFTDTYTGTVYVRDRVAQTTEPISVTTDGSAPDWEDHRATGTISDDGRYVTFNSFATNLVSPPAEPNVEHIYLRDRQTHTTQLITTLHPWHGAWAVYGGPKISGNGRYIAFYDTDSARIPDDTNGCPDAFLYDIVNATYERVSVDSNGNQLTNGCDHYDDLPPVISTDGRFVGFDSSDASLYGTPPTGSFMWHAYLRDRVAGTTRLVDDPAVDPVDGVATLSGISDDGRYATWSCEYCVDPAPAEPNQPEEMSFWTDLQTGHTEMVGMINGDEPTDLDTGQRTLTFSGGISADGSVVAFQTRATNLIPDDTNGKFDVYVERMW